MKYKYYVSRVKYLALLLFAIGGMIQLSHAWSLNSDPYSLDKDVDHIKQVSSNIYSININYHLKNNTKNSFNNYCLIEKDTSVYLPNECKKYSNGRYMTNYMHMNMLINIAQHTYCVMNINYYDRSNQLLQHRVLQDNVAHCTWNDILSGSSVASAFQFILDHQSSITHL